MLSTCINLSPNIVKRMLEVSLPFAAMSTPSYLHCRVAHPRRQSITTREATQCASAAATTNTWKI